MTRIIGTRAAGAALLLCTLTAIGVLLAPASSGASAATFGTLPSPCGTGHAGGSTDQGVTGSTISIAYGDDRGFSGSPGLDQEMGDAVKAMTPGVTAREASTGARSWAIITTRP